MGRAGNNRVPPTGIYPDSIPNETESEIQCSAEQRAKITQEVHDPLIKDPVVRVSMVTDICVSQNLHVEKKEGGERS